MLEEVQVLKVQVWVLSGLLASFFMVIWWGAKQFVTKVLERLDAIVESNQKTNLKLVNQEARLSSVEKEQSEIYGTLEKHDTRISNLERNYN
ncbi:MAG: DUF1517 domain-containing protein [Bacteroidales bacterium]|nr:DUF1517 domain-containing protein [Bacteroidales bacterium]